MRKAPANLRKALRENREAGILWWEDAAAEAYMLVKLGFSHQNKHIYHVLVDEAQNYSETELALLRYRYPYAHFTVLGDPRQRTCPGMPICEPGNWGSCFGVENTKLHKLMNCYRSTRQISEFCNQLLPENEEKMIPYGREGESVTVLEYSVETLRTQLEAVREKGYKAIAALTRTHRTAEELSGQLDYVYRLDGGDEDLTYETSDNVLAAYHMVKGMEFDAVIVVWPDMELTDLERHRLYTACTRALHKVVILTEGELLKTLGGLS